MILKKNPEIIYSILDSEVCLFNPNKGLYLNLNATGSIIWNLLDKFSTFEEIANELKEIFEVENSNYLEELKIFIEESQNLEILKIDE